MLSKLIVAIGIAQAALPKADTTTTTSPSSLLHNEDDGHLEEMGVFDLEPNDVQVNIIEQTSVRIAEYVTELKDVMSNDELDNNAFINNDIEMSSIDQKATKGRTPEPEDVEALLVSGRRFRGEPEAIFNTFAQVNELTTFPSVFLFTSFPEVLLVQAFQTHSSHSIYVSNPLEVSKVQLDDLMLQLEVLEGDDDTFVILRVHSLFKEKQESEGKQESEHVDGFRVQLELWYRFQLISEEDEIHPSVLALMSTCQRIRLLQRAESAFRFGRQYDSNLYMFLHCDDKYSLLDHQLY